MESFIKLLMFFERIFNVGIWMGFLIAVAIASLATLPFSELKFVNILILIGCIIFGVVAYRNQPKI